MTELRSAVYWEDAVYMQSPRKGLSSMLKRTFGASAVNRPSAFEFGRCRCNLLTGPETMDRAMSSHPICKKTSDKSVEE